jgi:uncharacterized membrane protein YhaH (DUF805 family)
MVAMAFRDPFINAGALLFAFEGRIGRRPFWIGGIAIALMLALADSLMRRKFGLAAAASASFLMGTIAAYPMAALAAKRGLDRGRSAFWGVGLVLALVVSSLVTALAARWLMMHAPLILTLLRFGTGAVWLVLLIDLGMMGSANDKIASDRLRNAAISS